MMRLFAWNEALGGPPLWVQLVVAGLCGLGLLGAGVALMVAVLS